MTFGGPHCFHLHSVGASARAGRIAKAKAKSAGGLHVLSPRAFTASHLSLARHERLAVAAIVLLRKARSATVGGRSDTPARTRDDDTIRWAGRLISHDMCHYSGMPTCKVGLGRTRQSGTPRPMQHDSSNLSSSSSSSSSSRRRQQKVHHRRLSRLRCLSLTTEPYSSRSAEPCE